MTVVQFRQRRHDLLEGRFFDEHGMEDAVLRIGFGVLLDTAAGERTVTDVHGEQLAINCLLAINRQHHMLRLMLNDGTDETEEVVDMMAAQIVLERLGFLAA